MTSLLLYGPFRKANMFALHAQTMRIYFCRQKELEPQTTNNTCVLRGYLATANVFDIGR